MIALHAPEKPDITMTVNNADTDQPEQKSAQARAHSNIALVKYWGKRDPELNLPATGSVSVTLDALYTQTSVSFDTHLAGDHFRFDKADWQPAEPRLTRFLDRVRAMTDSADSAWIESYNSFPTGAGLASSASGFAALALAATRAAGLNLAPWKLSVLARQGSGSAARSIFGGLVEMRRGARADGHDAHAVQLLGPDQWPLSVVVAITDNRSKTVGSTEGMTRTAETSPYFSGWTDSAERDLEDMRRAIDTRDFDALAEICEHSCLKMHALMMSGRPGLIYWNPATTAAIQAVRELRAQGVPVCFTIDAGPQLKAICEPSAAGTVGRALESIPGVLETRHSALGPDAYSLESRACI